MRIVNDGAPSIERDEQEINKDFLIRMFKIISKHDVRFEIDKEIERFKNLGYPPEEAKLEVRNKFREVLLQDNKIVEAIIENSGEDIYDFLKLINDDAIKERDGETNKTDVCRRLHIERIADIFCKYDFTVADDDITTGKEIVREMRKVYIANDIVQTINRGREGATAKPSSSPITIPDDILNALEQEDIIEDATARPLKWLKTKSLLAYFVEVANDELNLKHGERRQIRPFEAMFNEKGLTGSINDYKQTGQLPIGYEIIDRIFDNLLK